METMGLEPTTSCVQSNEFSVLRELLECSVCQETLEQLISVHLDAHGTRHTGSAHLDEGEDSDIPDEEVA